MLDIGVQFFGGRGGGGSGGARGGGRAGGGGSQSGSEYKYQKMEETYGSYYANNERSIDQMERELITEMSSSGEGRHSVGWRRETQAQIDRLREENAKIMRDSSYKSNPSAAPAGTYLEMGGYTYTKNKNGTWTTYKNGKRYPNRTNADIKRVFT